MIIQRLGLRHVQIIMVFLAVAIGFILRINMSVAIVAMTDKVHSTQNYPVFNWNEAEKSKILSAFFWGYILPQIVAGNFAEKFGSKRLLLTSIGICSLLTILIPVLANYGYFIVCITRLLQGFFQGCLIPCCTVLISKWIPPKERKSALTITYSGSNLGSVIGFLLSGFLSSTSGGWPSVFYVTGGIGCGWTLVWYFIGTSTPSENNIISATELNFIKTSMDHSSNEKKDLVTPWQHIATSMPLIAVLISHCGQNWGFWTIATQMPNYINSLLKINIRENGFLTSLPYVVGWGTAIIFSWISSNIRRLNIISKNTERKIWNSIALWGGALSLFILGVSQSKNLILVVTLLVITMALHSGIYNGFLTNHVDLSPVHCGTLVGITNSLSVVCSICAPLCVGWLVEDSNPVEGWSSVFYLSGAIMFATNCFYILFNSSEVQYWNESISEENKIGANHQETLKEKRRKEVPSTVP